MYSELVFSKSLTEITYDDLVRYFSSTRPESNTFEFKSYVTKDEKGRDAGKDRKERENAILKTICGFLNSEGGIIIWGAPEGVEVDIDGVKDKEFYGALTPVPYNIPKDQFMARIVNLITPSPSSVLYHQISYEGGFIYLFEATRSLFPPHQFQNTYYMRLDGHTRAAPHHYIEALMKQVKSADINGFIRNDKSMTARNHGVMPCIRSIHNFSRYIPAVNVSYSLIVDYGIVFYEDEERNSDQVYGRRDLAVFTAKTLHYNIPFSRTFYIAVPEHGRVGAFGAKLIIYADNCPVKVSSYQYEVFQLNMSPTPQVRLIGQSENQLSFLHNDSLGKTAEELAREADSSMLESMKYSWNKTPMYKKLDQ